MNAPAYLITDADGGTGSVSPRVIAALRSSGCSVRAFVHQDDESAADLRGLGTDVVTGDLTNQRDVHDALDGITRMFFSMSVSARYLEAITQVCAAALDHGRLEILVNMSQMTVSQMTITSTAESRQQRQHWLAEHVVNWSGLPAVHVRPTVFLENPLFSSMADATIRANGTLDLPFGVGRTSPIAARDVADVVTTILRAPQPHLRRIYELTGPATLDLDELATQYAQALEQPITAMDMPEKFWMAQLTSLGINPHLVDHIATIARLHRQDRYNRLTCTVEEVTGHPAQTVADYVREHYGPAVRHSGRHRNRGEAE